MKMKLLKLNHSPLKHTSAGVRPGGTQENSSREHPLSLSEVHRQCWWFEVNEKPARESFGIGISIPSSANVFASKSIGKPSASNSIEVILITQQHLKRSNMRNVKNKMKAKVKWCDTALSAIWGTWQPSGKVCWTSLIRGQEFKKSSQNMSAFIT